MRRLIVILLFACGSRGPLDIAPGPFDASTDATMIEAAVDVAPVDAGRETNPAINCFQCIQQQCGMQILACATNQACRDTLQCAVQNCYKNAGFDAGCLLQKCNQNLQAFAQVLSVVTCVTGKCGEQCITVLGGGMMMDIVPPQQ